jgi:hypothetical protein
VKEGKGDGGGDLAGGGARRGAEEALEVEGKPDVRGRPGSEKGEGEGNSGPAAVLVGWKRRWAARGKRKEGG